MSVFYFTLFKIKCQYFKIGYDEYYKFECMYLCSIIGGKLMNEKISQFENYIVQVVVLSTNLQASQYTKTIC